MNEVRTALTPGRFGGIAMLTVLAIAVWIHTGNALAAAKDNCVECHRSSEFMVTNKKLYDYFQVWQASAHGQEDVTCSDCHGGNASTLDKSEAHAGLSGGKQAVAYANIPETCGKCHDEEYSSYQKSEHARHLIKEAEKQQGPNCVTCHGSVGAAAPTVATVREICQHCHNDKSKNNPDIPQKAEKLLNDLGAIRGFRHFVERRADSERGKEILKELTPQITSLQIKWHSFDLKKIQQTTETLLGTAKARKDEIRQSRNKP